MKLLTKTTLYFVTVSIFVFFAGAFSIYQVIKKLEINKVEQELNYQKKIISQELKNIKSDFNSLTIISSGLIYIEKTSSVPETYKKFSDTLIVDNQQNNFVHYRKLDFFINKDNDVYKVSILKSLMESNYLIEKVALIVTSMVFFFLLTVFYIYKYFFSQIWSDFFYTMNEIRNFNLSSPKVLNFPESGIIEFNQINKDLEKMSKRIINDFNGLKEYTANLTHEVQTPLAVIKSKTELILQDTNLSEEQLKLAGDIYSSTIGLSKLVKTLTLLTKIENNLFIDEEQIDIEQLIDFHLYGFKDISLIKGIEITKKIISKPIVKINSELADILIINLIKNAIKHNIEKGKIEVLLSDKKLCIINSGNELDFNPEILFNRFSKFNKNEDSLGIGLSLVKKICEYYNFEINYNYNNNLHNLSINFE
ncbi:MAG: HAMP domain-containing histidine kinase [Bacteroidales bacterium]|nr:HAMP domain-containing histidine kinase [Bacteroidales bacterium]MBN2756195.1 HAMP domain-containing histidine kinase [Bacteroidales bacterium]